MDISNIIRKYAGRIVASIVGAFASWFAMRWGITLGAEETADLTAVGMGLYGIFYASIHKFINKWLNPGDAASSVIIKSEKAADSRARQISGE